MIRTSPVSVGPTDLLSAALRHQEDAEALLGPSPDQSWHLAGFAAECARKACLGNEEFRRALAHEHGRDADRLLDLVLALDAHGPGGDLHGWAPTGSALAVWSEAHRYDRRGSHASRAPALVSETAGHHDRVLTSLWLIHDFAPESL